MQIGNHNLAPLAKIAMSDIDLLDAIDLARDNGFVDPSAQPEIGVIFFGLLCLGLWLGTQQERKP